MDLLVMAKQIKSPSEKQPIAAIGAAFTRLFPLFAIAGMAAVSLTIAAPEQAFAQGLKHFYMARQQVQITDDAPLVNDQRTFPTAGQPGQGAGALPNRPMALPRAGFQPYSSNIPSVNTSLPQVVNGVPPKEALEQPVRKPKQGKTATAGALKDSAKTAKKTTNPPVTAAKAYSPYKGYDPGAKPAEQPAAAANASTGMQSRTKVKGVLHWARTSR